MNKNVLLALSLLYVLPMCADDVQHEGYVPVVINIDASVLFPDLPFKTGFEPLVVHVPENDYSTQTYLAGKAVDYLRKVNASIVRSHEKGYRNPHEYVREESDKTESIGFTYLEIQELQKRVQESMETHFEEPAASLDIQSMIEKTKLRDQQTTDYCTDLQKALNAASHDDRKLILCRKHQEVQEGINHGSMIDNRFNTKTGRKTPLMLAEDSRVAKALIVKGADISVEDLQGKLVLFHLSDIGYMKNFDSDNKFSPYYSHGYDKIHAERIKMMKMVIALGINVNHLDKRGDSVLQFLKWRSDCSGYQERVDELKAAGAKIIKDHKLVE